MESINLVLTMCVFTVVDMRSIDQVIQDVEIAYQENDLLQGKLPSKVWHDYILEGREEELVKLQLDMVLTKQTWDTIIDTDIALPPRERKRNAIKEKIKLWPKRIPYLINEQFGFEDKYKLLVAMDHWEEHTCLKFIEATESHFDLIEFVQVDDTCESGVGRMQGRQPINLAKPCMYKEIIVHEIGHALGLFHEHMRADRDDYVTIHWDNINDTVHYNFDKLKASEYEDYDKPYDYTSIMHYGKLFFSSNRTAGLVTIEPKDSNYTDIIGEVENLSFYDLKIVNEMYKCSEGCVEKVCPGDGFQGKNCECYCKGSDSDSVVACETQDSVAECDAPDIDLEWYNVYTKGWKSEVKVFDGKMFSDGAVLLVVHKRLECGGDYANATCADGNWTVELPPCGKGGGNADNESMDTETSDVTVIVGQPAILTCFADSNDTYKISWLYQQKLLSEDTQPLMYENRFSIYQKEKYEWHLIIQDVSFDDEGEYICQMDTQPIQKISVHLHVKDRPYCSMVNNAAISGSFDNGFTVECLEGYELRSGVDIDTFLCNINATWEPETPECNPAKCIFMHNTADMFFNSSEDSLTNGTLVEHDDYITLVCPPGHVPDQTDITCRFGTFDTPNGSLPNCTLVTCQAPPVTNVRFGPKKAEYIYGNELKMSRCKGNLLFVGSKTITCLNDGTWSGEATCRPFCEGGRIEFKDLKHRVFKDNIRYRKFGLGTYNQCARKCERFRRFLCRSFVFGYEKGRPQCRLYQRNPDESPGSVREKKFWTVAVRQCVKN